MKITSFNGLLSFTDAIADSDPNSNPIPVLGSWDGNLNPTLCSVKSSGYYNVSIRFAVQIGIGNVNKP